MQCFAVFSNRLTHSWVSTKGILVAYCLFTPLPSSMIFGQTGDDPDVGQLPPVMIIADAPGTDTRTVTVLGGDQITLGGIQEIRDFQTVLPNLSV